VFCKAHRQVQLCRTWWSRLTATRTENLTKLVKLLIFLVFVMKSCGDKEESAKTVGKEEKQC
jgi:hypothetical protein